MVMVSMIPNQKNPATTTTFVMRLLYFTCMKNRITSTAFVTAIVSATSEFHGKLC